MSQEKYDQRTEKSDDNAYAKGVAIGALFQIVGIAGKFSRNDSLVTSAVTIHKPIRNPNQNEYEE